MDGYLEELGRELPLVGVLFGKGSFAGVVPDKEYKGIRDRGLRYMSINLLGLF